MLALFCLLAFPRGSPGGLTKGCQCYWTAVAKSVCGVTIFSSSSAGVSWGADVPRGPGGIGDMAFVCLAWLLCIHLFSALGAGRVVVSEQY